MHGKGQQIVRGTAPSLCPSDANIWNNQLLGEMSWGFWDETDEEWKQIPNISVTCNIHQ